MEVRITIDQELTRPELAAKLRPKVSSRQLLNYLNIARKYMPEFQKFNDPKTGGIKGLAKLYEYHIPVLQEIRTLAREHTLAEIDRKFRKRAQKRKSDDVAKK